MSCRIRLIWFLIIAFLSFILPTDSKALSVPSRPYNFVTDIAGIIDSSYENRLNQYLKELEQKTTAQFAVLTIGSLEGADIENFSLTVARKWGLGQKGKDNGALFLIAYMDRKWRVEVGYGLEDLLLPDGLLGSIVRKHLLPNSRKEQLSRGIFEAALAIANVIAKDAGVQLTGMPQEFESTVKQEDAEPSGTKAGYKEIHNKTHVVDLKTEGKLVKTEKIKTIAEIDYKEKKFRFSFFTKDFDKKDWNKEEKLIPLHIRHTNVAPQYMGILILHPKNVKILESKQKGFLVRDNMFSKKYGWEELLPYKDHRNAQIAMGAGEKVIDILLSKIPFAKEAYKLLLEHCSKQNKEYYDSIFEGKENFVTTMIPVHIPKAIIGFTETAWSIEIPFDLNKTKGEQKMSFWINPAFGNPSVNYSAGTWSLGFGRLEGINIDFEFEKASINNKTMLITKTKPWEKNKVRIIKVPDSDVEIEMVYIPGGTFNMGSPRTERGHTKKEEPQHEVKVNDFWIGKYEVTNALWDAVMGLDLIPIRRKEVIYRSIGKSSIKPGTFKESDIPKMPAFLFSFNQCLQFITKLNKLIPGVEFRMPTEAEWEFTCKAGLDGQFTYGDDPNFSRFGDYAWYKGNTIDFKWAHPVGQKKPNRWGIYDIHGNVMEYCQDDPLNAHIDVRGWWRPTKGIVVRGGSAWGDPKQSRCAGLRGNYGANELHSAFGFRLAQTASKRPLYIRKTFDLSGNERAQLLSHYDKGVGVYTIEVSIEGSENLEFRNVEHREIVNREELANPISSVLIYIICHKEANIGRIFDESIIAASGKPVRRHEYSFSKLKIRNGRIYRGLYPIPGSRNLVKQFFGSGKRDVDDYKVIYIPANLDSIKEAISRTFRIPISFDDWKEKTAACALVEVLKYRWIEVGWMGCKYDFTVLFRVTILDKEEKAEEEKAPAKGRLYVDTDPSDARVRILNIAPGFYQGMELAPGRYNVEVSAQGHESQEMWPLLDAGEDKRLHIRLKRILKEVVDRPGNKVSNSIGMKFVYIQPGDFMMGSPSSEPKRGSDERQHRVTLTKGFYMGVTEVTQAQWKAVMGDNPPYFKGNDRPVEYVSWDNVQEFIETLNLREGADKYRLPTEAEWEYAARAGSTSRFSFGDDKGRLGGYAWYQNNSGQRTHPVAQKKSNAWGLYDMHGNVWEWVQDRRGKYQSGSVTNPKGPSKGSRRVFRGGSCYHVARYCRSAFRGNKEHWKAREYTGFRLVLLRYSQ